ncbi:hypothetical protein LTR78_001377 [Recurvomyces mirabilis]|uniref:Uncharacterized protein n=1 Tax=Recurvomyces mirabilis TaxID=574656 RepID=A0AAE0WW54_9PEZI|nr:hypothetical protein LTR78_001377 [Recurvomyces mirabilis]KAK5161354.1 hypothetical protein LTS14_001150 [Recurvomyces mirabilis]
MLLCFQTQPPKKQSSRKHGPSEDAASVATSALVTKSRLLMSREDRGRPVRQLLNSDSERLRYAITSPADRIRAEVAYSIEELSMPILSSLYITNRIGSSALCDAAAAVLVQTHRYSLGRYEGVNRKAPILQSYARAVTVARATIASTHPHDLESTIAGCSLLGILDCVLSKHDPEWKGAWKHWSGAQALLLSVPATSSHSILVRAAIYGSAALYSFIWPVFAGTPSPFEAEHWLQARPPQSDSDQQGKLTRLRLFSHQLHTRMPRLICMLRHIRSSDHDVQQEKQYDTAKALAEQLMKLEAREEETLLLHCIKVVQTTDRNSRRFTPISFQFPDVNYLDWALGYWKARLVITRISRILTVYTAEDLAKSCHEPLLKLETLSDPGNDLKAEELRLAKNILSSWEDALSRGPCASIGMTNAFFNIWTTLHYLEKHRGLPVLEYGEWILQQWPLTWSGWSMRLTMADLEEASRVVEGGPLSRWALVSLAGDGAPAMFAIRPGVRNYDRARLQLIASKDLRI